MALGRYFSDLWAREEQPENEFMRDQGPGGIEEELRPYKRQAMEAGREETQGYWSKLLGRLGMGGPEEEVPADYGFENQDVDFSRPELETATPDETLHTPNPVWGEDLVGGVPAWSRPRPPVDRKELARSGRNNSGILGALKKYAPLFGAATFDPRRRFGE
jgi:hypothetical protein